MGRLPHWKEGGKSLIDWAKWEPAITRAKNAMIWLRDKLLELKDAVGGWKTALEILAGFVAVTGGENGQCDRLRD